MNAPRRRACAVATLSVAALAGIAAAATAPPAQHARRIVTLAPNLTELVYSAGAGDRLVGADAYSDYPAAARELPRIGDAFQVDYERLLALRPDLVLVWDTGTPEPVIERISGLHLRVERLSFTHLEDVATGIKKIGVLAGTTMQASGAAQEYLGRLSSLRAEHHESSPVRVFYQISEKPLYTVNGAHLISQMIELCGGRNLFAELDQLAPAVSLEAVLERNPDAIITADGAQGAPLSVWKRWPHVGAVALGNLSPVHADHVARATPRLVEGVHELCDVIDDARRKLAPAPSGRQ
jgi:iron complex transport system substrate-binding protein